MTDDRDWSWMHRPQPVAAPPNEHLLWTLTKAGHRVEARVRARALGPELRILIDGELWWSQVVRPATDAAMTAAADQKHTEFGAKGWQPAE